MIPIQSPKSKPKEESSFNSWLAPRGQQKQPTTKAMNDQAIAVIYVGVDDSESIEIEHQDVTESGHVGGNLILKRPQPRLCEHHQIKSVHLNTAETTRRQG